MGGTSIKKGFQLTVINSSNAGIGTMSGNSTGTSIYTSGNRSICGHNTPGLGIWYVDWTAPATASGTVTIYTSGVISNSNGNNNGDQVVKTSLSFPSAASSNINSVANSNSFSVYPNPATDLLTIEFGEEASEMTIAIVDVMGRTVMPTMNQFSGNRTEISVNELPQGAYFITGTSEGYSFKKSIMITK